METNNNNTETATAAPEAPQDEYEYFDMVAKKYLPLPKKPKLDPVEYYLRWEDDDDPATEPKLPPDEEAEYFRRIREFRERRKEAGLKIDPETAEVVGEWGYTVDPYGIDPLLPRRMQQLQKNYFARSPGSHIWVCSCDLPKATIDALQKREMKPTPASPVDLPARSRS